MSTQAKRVSTLRPDLSSPNAERRLAVAAWTIPFLLILGLAVEGGGYDLLVRTEVTVVIWWVVILGAGLGALPVIGGGRAPRIAVGALVALTAWTALALLWSESAERSGEEVGRLAMYLGILLLALTAARRGAGHRVLGAVGSAVAVVAWLALISRLHPGWFPADDTAALLGTTDRLNYPLNNPNALAAFLALGAPLVLAFASSARTSTAQALAAGTLPATGLTLFYTRSLGGAVATLLAVCVFLVLVRERRPTIASLVVATLGTGVLLAAATQWSELSNGLRTSGATKQGWMMLALVVVVGGVTGLVQLRITSAVRRGACPPRLAISRRAAIAALAVGVIVAVAAVGATGAGGTVSDKWRDFTEGTVPARDGARTTPKGFDNGRYEVWRAALDASGSAPFNGIGPGAFEYWWTRHEGGSFIRDAHSVYLETLAEAGIVGLALLVAFIGAILWGGWRAVDRAGSARVVSAAALAGCASFCLSAGIDVAWEVPVISVAFVALAAAVLPSAGPEDAFRSRSYTRGRVLAALGGVAVLALALPTLLGTQAIRDSEEHFSAGRFDAAIDDARRAERYQPHAASPRLQRAIALEGARRFDEAAEEARSATRKEGTNWRTWLTLSRIEAKRGEAVAALAAYRKAKSLNPHSLFFAR